MKRIYELEIKKILELNTEDYRKLIDTECLFKGIPLLTSNKPEELSIKKFKKDIKMYKFLGFYFKTEEEVLKLRKFILENSKMFVKDYGEAPKFTLQDENSYHLQTHTEQFYSKELYDQIKKEKIIQDKLKSAYEKELKIYNKCLDEYMEIENIIEDIYESLLNLHNKTIRLKNEFDAYIKLAKDKETAFKFFKLAKQDKINEIDFLNETTLENFDEVFIEFIKDKPNYFLDSLKNYALKDEK